MCVLNLGIVSLIRENVFKEIFVVEILARNRKMKKGKNKAFP